MRRTRTKLVAVLAAATVLAGACTDEPPEVPAGPGGEPDEVLTLGREIYGDRCANCHAGDGGGGRGPKLAGGAVVETFPDPGDQAEFIREGKGLMPSFDDQLSDAEIDAVVRYTREVLR